MRLRIKHACSIIVHACYVYTSIDASSKESLGLINLEPGHKIIILTAVCVHLNNASGYRASTSRKMLGRPSCSQDVQIFTSMTVGRDVR